MKKFMKLIPALAMLLIATTLVSTATFAWFSMNDTVQATNMQVRAVAERGLLINEVDEKTSAYWDESATAAQTGDTLSLLYPSSTTNGTTWYHGKSTRSSNAADATANTVSANLINGTYETLSGLTAITAMSEGTATENTQAVYSTMGKSATADAGYYVDYVYYVKGTEGNAVTLGTTAGDMNLFIKSVVATLPGTQASEDLNKSLRVGIKVNSTLYIYAPVAGYDNSYFVAAGATATVPIAGNTETATDLASLPGVGADHGAPVHIYIWYEGEDTNCKSDNATAVTLDKISVTVTFELKEVPTPVVPGP